MAKSDWVIPNAILIPALNRWKRETKRGFDTLVTYDSEKIRQWCGSAYGHIPTDDIKNRAISLRKSGKLERNMGHPPGKNAKDKLEKSANPEYEAYLNSNEWKKLRAQAIKRDKACRLCNSQNRLEVHHRCYPEPPIELTDSLDNLTTLCRKHHKWFHENEC